MFSEFNAAARAVLTLAEQECRNASHYYLGTEHLLLAMAIAPPPDIAEYFRNAGIEPWQVKRALRDALNVSYDHLWEGVIVTPRAQRVCALANERKTGDLVAPLDILTAIVEDGGGVAARVLQTLAKTPANRPL
ncbi:MAG TPA: Clp protease N-terminal domain-containing protein [Candidatus Eremiobacteraceae bacterium]|nr:Clp protease N-terminal domain-containing protein [Candidatus Eremiobacteraceae bacterium]